MLFIAWQRHPHGAQDWHAAVQTGLVHAPLMGLLNLPDILTRDCEMSAAAIPLRQAPSSASPVAASLQHRQPCRLTVRRTGASADEDLPTSESDYELPAAIVLDRTGSWFRIALQRGDGWIERTDASDFLGYPDLLRDRLSYLPRGWNGQLWGTPGAPTPSPLPAGWRARLGAEIPIEFLRTMQADGRTWMQVRLDPSKGCSAPPTTVAPITGWIPIHRPSGQPSAWFFSRGC